MSLSYRSKTPSSEDLLALLFQQDVENAAQFQICSPIVIALMSFNFDCNNNN